MARKTARRYIPDTPTLFPTAHVLSASCDQRMELVRQLCGMRRAELDARAGSRQAGHTAAIASISSRQLGLAGPRRIHTVLACGGPSEQGGRLPRAFRTSCRVQQECVTF